MLPLPGREKGAMFVRVCSGWSLGCGLVRPDPLLEWTVRSALPAVCLADFDNLYGAIEFYQLARQRGIKPVLAAVITGRSESGPSGSADAQRSDTQHLNRDSHLLFEADILVGRTKIIVQHLSAPKYVAIAVSQAGYENLCRLITARHMAASFDLAETAGRYQHGLAFLVDDPLLLCKLARRVELSRLFAEITDYGDDRSRARCYTLIESSAALGIEPIACHAAYFHGPRDWHLHRVLRSVVLNQLAGRVALNQLAPVGAWLAPADQLRDRLARYGKGPLRNAHRLIEQCDLKLQLGVPHFPTVSLADGETARARLCRLVWDGLAGRYPSPPADALPRLKHELHVITKMGFADYFLAVHEIVQFARTNNIGCIGRGSAADSLVTYCLGISDVDPLRYKLHFERFLNESRTDYPDIDLDFDWRRRDEVIRFVYEHWGRDRVAMISTQHFYKARSAFRDAARALGMPTDKLNKLTGRLPYDEADNLPQAIASMPECRDFPLHDPQVAKAVRIATHLAGLPRGLSVHVGGVVISPKELVCYSPLQPATKGIAITQYDMRAIEKVGLVKIDLLGHRSLAILADCLDLVQRNHDIRVDLPSLPEDDPDTARVLTSGRTVGCFQIESPGVRQLLQMLQAKDLQDVIHALSLIRPGPSASGMKEHFIKRKRGLEPVTYLHPAMKDVLAETYGVMLYQEDVMMVAAAVAGFTMSTGDSLRKALEKPDSQEHMARLKSSFMEGAVRRGCDEPTAEHIWLLVSNFAAYSYNKAHACTYGKISYWCTWMKAHYPAEFLTGVLNNVGGYYALSEYLEEARRLGVPILPPHVNESDLHFVAQPVAVQPVLAHRLNRDSHLLVPSAMPGAPSLARDDGHAALGATGSLPASAAVDPVVTVPPTPVPCPLSPAVLTLRRIGIRVALSQIRNLTEKTAQAIIQQRQGRPFESLADLLGRVPMSSDEARALIFSGACDGLGPSRPAMLWQLSAWLRQGKPCATLKQGTASLFPTVHPGVVPVGQRGTSLRKLSDPAASRDNTLPVHLLGDYDPVRLAELERQYLTFSPVDHPLGILAHALIGHDIVRSIDIGQVIGRTVTVAGIIVASRRAVTRRRELMQFITLEDRWGLVEVVLFPDVYKQLGGTFNSFGPYLVTGAVQENLGSVVLVGKSVQLAANTSHRMLPDPADPPATSI
jgi:DNA polymerase III subunit alpha